MDKVKVISDLIKKQGKFFLAVLIIFLVLALVYLKRSLFVSASVNGQFISRYSFVKELEHQAGKEVLDSLVTKTLLLSEAKKRNIKVSDEELKSEIKKIEDSVSKQNQKLDDLLALRGQTRLDLEESIRIQKTVEKLLEPEIKITDKDIDDYLKNNQSILPKDKKPEEVRSMASDSLRQQKLGEKFQEFLDNLKKSAKIVIFQ